MAPPPERATYSVIEAGKVLGLSRNSMYAAVRCGQIPIVKIGSKMLVPKVAIERLLSIGPRVPVASIMA